MKKYFILSMLTIFAFSIKVAGQKNINDTLKIFREIAGDYEIYSDQQYYNIHLYIEHDTLLFQGRNVSDVRKTIMVDLKNLKLNISDSNKVEQIYFIRNRHGKISACRWINSEGEFFGNKLDKSADTLQIADEIYSVEALKADLSQIKNILISYHPAVYQFTSKELFEEIFNRQFSKINRPMNLREFFLIAAPIVESVHCVHTSLNLPDKFWNNESQISFPARLTFIGNKAYIISFYKNETVIPIGSEILSIDKIPMTEIIKSTTGLISSDGRNETWKPVILKFTFSDLYALTYGFKDQFEVEYTLPGRDEVSVQILYPVKRSFLWSKSGTNTEKRSAGDPNLNLEVTTDKKLATLTIKSFAYYQERGKFYSFIDSAFDLINKSNIRSLILDFRDNMGGDPYCTSHLLSYIEIESIPYFAKAYPYGYEHFAEPIPLSTKNTFAGNIFLLINGGCISSTGHLCSILKFHKRCTFIGEETGGTYECNDGRAIFNTKETRLNLSVARMTFTAAVAGLSREKGIIPDFKVKPQIDDIIQGKDTVKEFAIKLIEKSK